MTVGGAGVRVGAVAPLDQIREKKIVVLAVASYPFRARVTLYCKPDAATHAWFERAAEEGAPVLSDEEFLDRAAGCGQRPLRRVQPRARRVLPERGHVQAQHRRQGLHAPRRPAGVQPDTAR